MNAQQQRRQRLAHRAQAVERRIVCDYVNPPIPIREFDYCATFAQHDIGDPQGYGATKAEAIADLQEKAEELRSAA